MVLVGVRTLAAAMGARRRRRLGWLCRRWLRGLSATSRDSFSPRLAPAPLARLLFPPPRDPNLDP